MSKRGFGYISLNPKNAHAGTLLWGLIYMSTVDRLRIAEEIVRRVDTVTLLRCGEVADIRSRALAGQFDDMAKDLLNDR